MRALHVFTVPVTRNGITMFALQRAEALRRAGVTLDYVSPNEVEPALRGEIEAHGARVFVLSQKRPGVAYVRALARLVRKNRYALVHAHGNSASLACEMLAAWLGGCRARVAHCHNTTCNHIRQDRRLRPLFYRSYTAAAACGTDAGNWLYGNRPFTVLPNAVNTAAFRFDPAARAALREQLGLQNALVVGHVGRFNGQKNHQFLLEVFAELGKLRPEARLLLVGDGYLEKRVREAAAPLGDRVLFAGSVPDPWRYLNAMDVMAFPSLYEGFPTVLLEWQCAGLPVVASDTVTREAALTELVTYKPLADGAAAWARALADTPLPARESASARAVRTLCARGYDLADAAARLLDFYREIARPRRGGRGDAETRRGGL